MSDKYGTYPLAVSSGTPLSDNINDLIGEYIDDSTKVFGMSLDYDYRGFLFQTSDGNIHANASLGTLDNGIRHGYKARKRKQAIRKIKELKHEFTSMAEDATANGGIQRLFKCTTGNMTGVSDKFVSGIMCKNGTLFLPGEGHHQNVQPLKNVASTPNNTVLHFEDGRLSVHPNIDTVVLNDVDDIYPISTIRGADVLCVHANGLSLFSDLGIDIEYGEDNENHQKFPSCPSVLSNALSSGKTVVSMCRTKMAFTCGLSDGSFYSWGLCQNLTPLEKLKHINMRGQSNDPLPSGITFTPECIHFDQKVIESVGSVGGWEFCALLTNGQIFTYGTSKLGEPCVNILHHQLISSKWSNQYRTGVKKVNYSDRGIVAELYGGGAFVITGYRIWGLVYSIKYVEGVEVASFYPEAHAIRSVSGHFRSFLDFKSNPSPSEIKRIETTGIKGIFNNGGAALVHLQDKSIVVWGDDESANIDRVKRWIATGVESVAVNTGYFAVVTCDGSCITWGKHGSLHVVVPANRMPDTAKDMLANLSMDCKNGTYQCFDSTCASVVDEKGDKVMKSVCVGWCKTANRICKMLWSHTASGLCHHHTDQQFNFDKAHVLVPMKDVIIDNKSTTPNSIHIRHKNDQWNSRG